MISFMLIIYFYLGQTREVHIYRLVTESTVEENILVKAKQKKHLDFLVMTEGNFSEESLLSSQSLQEMFGVNANSVTTNECSKVEMEAAMQAAEDDDDILAMKSTKAEIEKEGAEFDENAPVTNEDDDGPDDEPNVESDSISVANTNINSTTATNNNNATTNAKDDEKELEAEFASWQAKIGPDYKSLESTLKPIEKYAIHVHTDIEPFYSMYFLNEQQRLEAMAAEEKELNEQWDIDAIEKEKEEDEYRALAEGELLATNISSRREVSRLKYWFLRERSMRMRDRRRRIMTGESWAVYVDAITSFPFWYNNDTGEASYSKPKVIEEKEIYETALSNGFSHLPKKALIRVFEMLCPAPDRNNAALSCSRWQEISKDDYFNRKVLPVESGARENVESLGVNTYSSLQSAIDCSLPWDVIVLGLGHHWESDIHIRHPLRIVGDTNDAQRCIVEFTGTFYLDDKSVSFILSNVSLRRPRRISSPISAIIARHTQIMV